MLTITIPAIEGFDDEKQEFVTIAKEQTLQLEHSLVSISKWESKWHKPFISREEKTVEETMDYIRCMTVTQNIDPDVYNRITRSNVDEINKYIEDPMTATTFYGTSEQGRSKETITSDLIYYWMVSLNIPMECQKWHLNRLLTLIRVCNVKNAPPKKRGAKQIISDYARINAERRKKLNTKG